MWPFLSESYQIHDYNLPFFATVLLNLSTAVCFSLQPPQELNCWKIYRKLNKFLLVVQTALLSLVGKTQCFDTLSQGAQES